MLDAQLLTKLLLLLGKIGYMAAQLLTKLLLLLGKIGYMAVLEIRNATSMTNHQISYCFLVLVLQSILHVLNR